MTKTELKKNITKIKKLLKQRDYGNIDTGIELARSLDEPTVFERLLEGCVIDEKGKLIRNKIFSGTGPAQPYLDYALVNLIGYAPKNTKVDKSLEHANIKTLSLADREWLELPFGLANLTNLISLDLSYCSSLQNVDVLANLPNLTSLNLSDCYSLQNVDGLANLINLTSLDLYNCDSLQNVDGLECCINITELYIDNAGILRNVNAIGNLKNLKSLLITNCPEILPEPKHKDMNTPEKVEEYQKMIEAIYKKGKIDIKTIVDDIDPDLLTTTLESFGDSLSDFNDHVLLLNITKKDLINKNFDNIIQVGYIRDYGDRDELDGLIWWYFKKCREWYGMYDLYSPISDQAAKKEAKTVWDEEKNYGNTSLILLYCEGEYVWAYGS